jgi:YidC/Oxa1 family membrane protein insertase
MQAKNWIAFLVVAAVVSVLWLFVLPRWFAPKKGSDKVAETSSRSSESSKSSESKSGSSSESKSSSSKSSDGSASSSSEEKAKGSTARLGPPLEKPPAALAKEDPADYTIGSDHDFLEALFTKRGGGLRKLVLKKFKAADREGKPLTEDGEPVPLVLIPDDPTTPSFLTYLYPPDEDRPLDTLGKVEWTKGKDDKWTDDDGAEHIRFHYDDKVHGLTITKTFTLRPRVYDLRLQVKIERTAASGDKKIRSYPVQYQLTGAHGLPIEGGWYTGTYRNAIVGQIDSSKDLDRDLQDLKKISHGLGGTTVSKGQGKAFLYAGVVVQYFGSVIGIDQKQDDTDFIDRVQPTVESLALRGKYVGRSEYRKGSDEEGPQFFEVMGDDKELHRFQLPDAGWDYKIKWADLEDISRGDEVVVRYRLDEKPAEVAMEIVHGGKAVEQLYFDDITVRMVTKPAELKEKDAIVHDYILYNGPVKVALLEHMGVSSEDVAVYKKELQLNTLTDYASPNFISENFFKRIGWTTLLIWCTNRIHDVLHFLHTYVMPWNYGLCIILLTFMVRGLMFPLSRKQALMTMKMQALAPEIKKIQEKHKEDRQALTMATMELYRRHGVNPLGTCWVALLQMPIFLGLYYALQESVELRLQGFLWIRNLAAPDMLLGWSSKIPFLSSPGNFGGWFYLGPYLNVLPVFAVTLMIVQQKYMMPPAQDEQQATQQKMMKFMMIIMGLLFYKVAAGLGLYFITSSVWSFCERKLLPKKKALATPAPGAEAKPGLLHRFMMRVEASQKAQAGDGSKTARAGVTSTPPARRKKRGKQDGENGQRSWFQGLKDWWAEILKKAEKK